MFPPDGRHHISAVLPLVVVLVAPRLRVLVPGQRPSLPDPRPRLLLAVGGGIGSFLVSRVISGRRTVRKCATGLSEIGFAKVIVLTMSSPKSNRRRFMGG